MQLSSVRGLLAASLVVAVAALPQRAQAAEPERRSTELTLDLTVLSVAYTFTHLVTEHFGMGGFVGIGPPLYFLLRTPASILRLDAHDMIFLGAGNAGVFMRGRFKSAQLEGGVRASVGPSFIGCDGCDASTWRGAVGPYLFVSGGFERVQFGPRVEMLLDPTHGQSATIVSPLIVRWIIK